MTVYFFLSCSFTFPIPYTPAPHRISRYINTLSAFSYKYLSFIRNVSKFVLFIQLFIFWHTENEKQQFALRHCCFFLDRAYMCKWNCFIFVCISIHLSEYTCIFIRFDCRNSSFFFCFEMNMKTQFYTHAYIHHCWKYTTLFFHIHMNIGLVNLVYIIHHSATIPHLYTHWYEHVCQF